MADSIMFAFSKSDADGLVNLLGSKNGHGSNPIYAPEPASCLVAITTSTITARAGTTLGTGTAQAQYIDNSNVLQNYETLTVYNAGSAIANGAYVLLFRSGAKWLAVEIC